MNTEKFYHPQETRYTKMKYRRCGESGIQLPLLSLGLWHNFGFTTPYEQSKEIVFHAFDQGITHFDLANNYGPPYGAAEKTFGAIIQDHLRPYRDELIISSKAGYDMWPGPYGDWGSRKHLMASIDQSLKRMKLDYVDIFYSHRFDPHTPLEETMSALETIYKQGKALYVGISSYSASKTKEAERILNSRGVHCLIHQPSYSMINRWTEDELLDTLTELGIGCIAFSPLAQGVLTSKYLNQIPENSRIKYAGSVPKSHISAGVLARVRALNAIAKKRGQTLAQMSIAWVLRRPEVTSALIGVSKLEQLKDCVGALKNLKFSDNELTAINKYAVESKINLWKPSSDHK